MRHLLYEYQKYWDGWYWHDAMPARPGAPTTKVTPPPRRFTRREKIAAGSFLAVACAAVVAAAVIAEPSPISLEDAKRSVIDLCQGSVRAQLRDPDGAKFSEWTAQDLAGERYSASGLVNAKNGFGGYVGDHRYECDATVSSKGDVKARAHDTEG